MIASLAKISELISGAEALLWLQHDDDDQQLTTSVNLASLF